MKLFFRKYGNGPPLIILHGLYGSSDNWISIARNLSMSFSVFLPDQRNHGLSPHSEVHDYESMKNDLYEMASDLNLGKFFLAGHSMGGKTAISFALTWPEKLNGLLIADISPFKKESRDGALSAQHLEILHTILKIDLSGFKSRSEVESILRPRIRSEETRGLIMKNLKRETNNSFAWKLNADSLLKNFDRILEKIEVNETANFEIAGFPVYFLKGEFSDYLPEKDYRKILKIFPAAEFIVIPGAGHWIQTNNPDMVTRCFLKLLA